MSSIASYVLHTSAHGPFDTRNLYPSLEEIWQFYNNNIIIKTFYFYKIYYEYVFNTINLKIVLDL